MCKGTGCIPYTLGLYRETSAGTIEKSTVQYVTFLQSAEAGRILFKGAVSRDLRPLFFHKSNPSGPLINKLK